MYSYRPEPIDYSQIMWSFDNGTAVDERSLATLLVAQWLSPRPPVVVLHIHDSIYVQL